MKISSSLSRRNWLKQSLFSIAGAAILPPSVLDRLHGAAGWTSDVLAGQTPEEESYWEFVKAHFSLEPGLRYFNNASLGPSPDIVRQATQAFRDTLDGFPSKYMWGGWEEEKEAVRKKAARLLQASPEEIALTHNTTEGMNLIASSLDLQPGDEVIIGNHEHHTANIPWIYHQERKGIRLVRPTLPLIPDSPEELVEVYRRAITPRTRVISIVHLTNTNGMILPIKAISEMAHERGILVAVDGAQSMAMTECNLPDLGCDFFATSCHKWLFSPKGTGLFYARKEAQHHLKAMIVCKGYDDESIRRLENYNTRNLPEVLGLGAAIDYHNLIGTENIQRRIYTLKHYFLEKIAGTDKLIIKTPPGDDLSAGIVNVEVRDRKVTEVKDKLYEHHGIDCRPMTSHGLNGLRISLSIYNTKADVDELVAALKDV